MTSIEEWARMESGVLDTDDHKLEVAFVQGVLSLASRLLDDDVLTAIVRAMSDDLGISDPADFEARALLEAALAKITEGVGQ